MKFHERLRELRDKNKMTQQDIANKLGITRQAYGYYESPKSNKREPDHETTVKLAEIFDVTTDYLLCRTDDPNESKDDFDKDKFLFFDEENMDEDDWELVKQTYEALRKKKK